MPVGGIQRQKTIKKGATTLHTHPLVLFAASIRSTYPHPQGFFWKKWMLFRENKSIFFKHQMLSHGIELWEYYIITYDGILCQPTDTAGYPPSKPLKTGVPTYNPHFVRPDRGPRHKTRGGNDNEFLTFAVRHVRREYMYTK